MNVLVIGQGGREHAIAWKLSKSPRCGQIFVAPGNGGTHTFCKNLPFSHDNEVALDRVISEKDIQLIVIGPENPLAEGLADRLREKHDNTIVIGPGEKGAQLESSKAFAKAFMKKYSIPTANYIVVTSEKLEDGLRHIGTMTAPIVLKADGLAAGKGVVICETKEEAKQTLRSFIDGQFGKASSKVVIEEFLRGREYSVFALTDGRNYKILPVAKDYKRVGEGDHGLNTGGMGAVSPVSFVTTEIMEKTIRRIVEPTIQGLITESIDYHGIIFFGLIEVSGEPYVIEYNCRFGDPETEVVLPRIENDLIDLFERVSNGQLTETIIHENKNACATVMMVSGGYPVSYKKGFEITGLEDVQEGMVFHAGTTYSNEKILTSGGRVLAITSTAEHWRKALDISYKQIQYIKFDKQYYRTDIGFDL